MSEAIKEEKKSIFETLRQVDVSEHIEKKNGLNYVSWAWAWDTLMKLYPKSSVDVKRNETGRFWFDDGRTGWVEVSVTVQAENEVVERSELFPVMDYKNNPIPADKITSFNANTAVQRATTKAIARHGLGLYVYAGEDLPPDDEGIKEERKVAENEPKMGQKEAEGLPATEGQVIALRKYSGTEYLDKALEYYGVEKVEDLTVIQASQTLKAFAKKGMN